MSLFAYCGRFDWRYGVNDSKQSWKVWNGGDNNADVRMSDRVTVGSVLGIICDVKIYSDFLAVPSTSKLGCFASIHEKKMALADTIDLNFDRQPEYT